VTYFYLFLQSNLLEVPVYYLFLRRKPGMGFLYCLAFVTFMNSLTHPVVFFGLMSLPFSYLANILIAEAFAIGSETLFLRFLLRSGWSRAFAASLLANLVSWQLAPMLTYLLFG
jgi:hypothetical protein